MAFLTLIFIVLYTFLNSTNAVSNSATAFTKSLISPKPLLFPSSIRKCSENSQLPEAPQFPVLSVTTEGNALYGYKTFQILESLPTCLAHGEPISSPLSVEHYQNVLDQDHMNLTTLFLSQTIILEDGYLSVGTNGNLTEYYSTDEFCVDNHAENPETHQFYSCLSLHGRTLVTKCCPFGMILKCPGLLQNKDIDTCSCQIDPDWKEFYPNAGLDLDASIIEGKAVPFYKSRFPLCSRNHGKHRILVGDGCESEFFPRANNQTAYLEDDWFLKSLSSADVCFDLKSSFNQQIHFVMLLCKQHDAPVATEDIADHIIHITFMFTGAFLYILTALIYIATWPKQNLHGRTLCGCILAKLGLQMAIGVTILLALFNIKGTPLCFAVAVFAHYGVTAAFSWLVVVNFDLWWTFRSLANPRTNDTRRFYAYAGLGWGIPLIVVTVSLIMDSVFKCPTSKVIVPRYGTTINCYIAFHSKSYYVHILNITFAVLSFIFAGATVISFCRTKKATKASSVGKKSSQSAKHREGRFILLLKLLLLMGLGFALEEVAWAVGTTSDYGSNFMWKVADLYTFISPLLIFFLFGLNDTTLRYLADMYPCFKGATLGIRRVKSKIRKKIHMPRTEETTANTTSENYASGSTVHSTTADGNLTVINLG